MFDGLSLMSDGKFYVLLLEAPEIPDSIQIQRTVNEHDNFEIKFLTIYKSINYS